MVEVMTDHATSGQDIPVPHDAAVIDDGAEERKRKT